MAQLIAIEVGPARSGKTHRLLERYCEVLNKSAAVGRTLWVSPTSRAAGHIRERILAGGVQACLAPGVLTFDGLADAVLAECRDRLWPLDSTGQRALVRRVVARALDNGQLDCFAATALSDGFVDLVVEHFRELKRREIEPQTFANGATPRGRTDEHAALARLYSEYQRFVSAHQLADREGRHWIARDLLARGECGFLSRLELVVVDGFTDFTPTQHDMLQQLALRTEELRIAVPGEVEHARPDLFAKTAATLAELKHRHPNARVLPHPARPSSFAANDRIAAHLFSRSRISPPINAAERDSLRNVEFVAASGQQDEIVQIARRIKRRMASENTQPEDIVVVLRLVSPSAERVRETFDEYGIPFFIESQEKLLDDPSVRALVNILQLAEEDWPFRKLVALLGNSLLTAIADDSREKAVWLVRDLQIAAGRADFLQQAKTLASLDIQRDLSETQRRRATAAVVAWPALRHISEALDQLPETATHDEWCAALANLGAHLGIPAFKNDFPSPAPVDADALGDQSGHAWQQIRREIRSLARLDKKLGYAPAVISRAELLRLILDIASHESRPTRQDSTGRVAVIRAESARNVPIRHLYLAGMSEQAFPLPEPAGRFYSEAQYRAWSRAGKAGRSSKSRRETSEPGEESTRAQEEMLLYYEVVTRAQESITISYPALDDRAQCMPPSPYVAEVIRLFGAENLTENHAPPRLAPIVAEDSPLSPAEWRLLGVHRALEGNPALLAGLVCDARTSDLGRAIAAGLQAVHARANRDRFSEWEGLLTSAAAADRLARRFNAEHLWSTSQWEMYATCPYKFFLAGVLGLRPLGELALDTDFAGRGGALHNVFARFYRDWSAAGRGAVRTKEHFATRMQAALAAEFGSAPRHGLDAALSELNRRQIVKWADKHFDHLEAYQSSNQSLAPVHLELRFGPSPQGAAASDDPSSLDQPFELDLGGEKVRVIGRIDRIDVGQVGDRTVFSVIDYKTGKTIPLKPEQIESGERLQLPIYVAAAQALLFKNDAKPIAAGYWTMNRGFDHKGVLNLHARAARSPGEAVEPEPDDELWEKHFQSAVAAVRRLVAGIRRGEFPVHSRDEHCTGRCEFNTVCRVAQVRALTKSWPTEAGDE